MLSTDALKFDIADALRHGPKGRAGLDRLQLHRIANQHDLGRARFHFRQNPRELPGGHHPGFINDEHVIPPKLIAALRPGQFPGRQRAGLDAR